MAGVARFDPGEGLASATDSYAISIAYATSATPKPAPVMNKMGLAGISDGRSEAKAPAGPGR